LCTKIESENWCQNKKSIHDFLSTEFAQSSTISHLLHDSVNALRFSWQTKLFQKAPKGRVKGQTLEVESGNVGLQDVPHKGIFVRWPFPDVLPHLS
jgi:hypothetical protein